MRASHTWHEALLNDTYLEELLPNMGVASTNLTIVTITVRAEEVASQKKGHGERQHKRQ